MEVEVVQNKKSTELTSQLGAGQLVIDQLPVGLLAQLVERYTGIAEVMGSNPVRA